MQEVKANLWRVTDADAICIPTNGYVKKNGDAVMGAGVAKQATRIIPNIQTLLGNALAAYGNHVQIITYWGEVAIVAFPTKGFWKENSLPWLIKRSAKELVALADREEWEKIGLPRPGCGNGGLDWMQIKPKIAKTLDDRFWIVDKAD